MPPTGKAASEPEGYLAVLKAAYDYEPQSDDEIALKEDQLLLLVERTDEDWWKVKVKGETQDDDEGPLGLVPAAYVEQATHTSQVKVLYDYEAAAPGELSVKEDDILLLFETDGDWILAQSHTGDGAGYVPGNYVETSSSTQEAVQDPVIVVPESPPRPSATYEDPATRVQANKLSADDIKTWSVSEVDKKGKKKKGTLGIGNGSLFFASESDKAAVQKWQTSDVTDASIDKPKHILIEIAGADATSLHFHAGSKEGAEEILAKVLSSKALATSSSASGQASAPRRLPPMADSSANSMKRPSVHFSESSPVIIPPRPQVDDGTDDEEEPNGDDGKGESAVALYEFKADGDDELSVAEGEQLLVLERDDDDWWKCRNAKGAEGVVPAQYVQIQAAGSNGSTTASRAQDESRAKAELLAQEQAEREEAERAEEERRREEERQRKKLQAEKARAAAAEADRERQKKAQNKSPSPKSPTRPDSEGSPSASASSSKTSSEVTRPPPDKTRTWHDRSGQFRVDAAFLGFNGGKLRLHKVNGVIVEVPAEKMSLEDMKYVEHVMSKKGQDLGEDVPLAIAARVNAASGSNGSQNRAPPPPKKAPRIDWFDFFLSAGCDMDDCTRYAQSFERDKIDETILPDVTDSTMRSLGLKEGDIIRVKKAIEKRRPTENLIKPSPYVQDQIKRDEEIARQLQAQENSGRGNAPNLFAGPGGVLKNPRRGRPQPTKSLPLSNVDIKAITNASEAIQRTSSPQASTPLSAEATSNAVNAPPRSSSALAAPSSGFEDNAWTPRPSSTKPLVGTPPPARAPSAPPAPAKVPTPPAPAVVPTVTQTAPVPQPPAAVQSTTPNLAKTTEADIFEQLARLSNIRSASSPVQPLPQQQAPPVALSASPSIQTPPSFHVGMGVSHSPLPLGQLQAHTPTLTPTPQPYNGPRGPFAPVPSNQGLLQPLIPTQTGFNSFVPTRAPALQNPPPLPMQNTTLQPMIGGLSAPQMSPTGLLPQQTGIPMNGAFNAGFGAPQMGFQNSSGFGQMQPMQPLQPQFTSFNPAGNAAFNGLASAPPLPSAPVKDNSPANVFASMKSGTFENDNQNNSGPRPPDMYDALRANPSPQLQMQPTGWGQPTYGMGFQR